MSAKSCCVVLGLCLTAGAVLSGKGVLVGTTLESDVYKGVKADRAYVFNRSVRVCRYLHLSGMVDRRSDWDAAGARCAFAASS